MKTIARSILILILAFSVNFSSHAQEGMKIKADKLFNSLSYYDAIENYKLVIARDSNDGESLIRLADCYRLTNNIAEACKTYRLVIQKGYAQSIHKYYYAQALLQTGAFDEAIKFMKELTSDERGSRYLDALQHMESFFRDSASYRISEAPFNTPMHDFSPAILNNEIIFTSSRERAEWIQYSHTWTGRAFYNLYSVKKNDDGTYTKARRFARSATERFNNGPASFGDDGRSMWITRNNIQNGRAIRSANGNVRLVLIRAKYYPESKKWIESEFFPYNSNEYSCAHASVSSDGKVLYFASDMPGGAGGMDLWYCIKTEEGWGKPINAGSQINTNGNEVFPYLVNNTLYFSSDGQEGMGGLDIYMIRLDKNYAPTGILKNMGFPVNSHGDDFGICFTSDLMSGFLSSNRKELDENDDIYRFTIIKPVQPPLLLTGLCRDKNSKNFIAGVHISLLDAEGKLVSEAVSDKDGNYSFIINAENQYKITAQKESYEGSENTVEAVNAGYTGKISVISELSQRFNMGLNVVIKDEKSGQLLSAVQVSLTNPVTGANSQYTSDENGKISIALENVKAGDRIAYLAGMKKEGYFDKSTTLETTINSGEESVITVTMAKPEVGMDLGKLINLNPIYFDKNMYNIRPDAAKELDKIVEIMKEYPHMKIELGSHTDCRAPAAYNMTLSENRAKSSVAYIISKGIDPSRISGKGYGESKPVNKCECEGNKVVPCSEQEHQMNRRTEFIIVGNE
jgi:outer membrane protein OmpA-like peptidoglycan-associated protein/tetratricopeptide (TPR) repeat protein